MWEKKERRLSTIIFQISDQIFFKFFWNFDFINATLAGFHYRMRKDFVLRLLF